MKSKLFFKVAVSLAATALLSMPVLAKYPSSGKKAPEGSVLITGKLIGEETGWDGTPGTGRASAFDGDIYSYYDPTSGANTDCYAGVKLNEKYVLTKVLIMPRENWNDRFEGAMIQGSNDGKKWTTLWQSKAPAKSWDWQEITKFKSNTGYSQYRYCNDYTHGDVAEVELYGYSGTGSGEAAVIASKLGEMSVSFDANGGKSGKFDPITVKFGESYPDVTYIPENEGLEFTGWYTSPEGGKKADSSVKVTSPVSHTLYAHWSDGTDKSVSSSSESEETDIAQDEVSRSEPILNPIQKLCVTLSLMFILAAAAVIIIKRV